MVVESLGDLEGKLSSLGRWWKVERQVQAGEAFKDGQVSKRDCSVRDCLDP